jgi:transketolase
MLNPVEFIRASNRCRLDVLDVGKRVGGVHIGGIFSILDFLILYYSKGLQIVGNHSSYYFGTFATECPQLIFSKGHCYLAQLVALDYLCMRSEYSDSYLVQGNDFFGHPKRSVSNSHFPISSGSLGQGIVFAGGIAYGNKQQQIKSRVIVILGDGELNEGSCTEAMLFAAQHKLPITYVLDSNKQMSLDTVQDIFSNGKLEERFSSYGLDVVNVDGHSYIELSKLITNLYSKEPLDSGPKICILNTIKGRGVSFMECDPKWHHRRLKANEYTLAVEELLGKDHEK